ncbi:MAG TPA: hypothetical protein VFA94_04030 [Acidimicrobiales bacterium]|nr:hypothetical protein [Acidimicrobiales bacterium]
MHPIERLRWVARAEGAGPSLLAQESAAALASFGDDPQGLVTACRRLVSRHPVAGPVWWLVARVLSVAEPVSEAWQAASALEEDTTPGVLAAALPDDALVVVVGWPEQAGAALARRGDLEVLVADAGGEGGALARRLRSANVDAVSIPDAGIGSAVAEADLVLLEADALGPDGFVSAVGARAAGAAALHAGVPVWVVAGVGRVLPGRLWEALVQQLDSVEADPWERAEEIVPLDLATVVFGPVGPQSAGEAVRRADCPVAPELLKPLD